MLEGDLADFSLPDILRLLSFTHKTGRLHVRNTPILARVDLVDGRVRDASADAARLSLARRLLGAGLVDTDHLRTTLDDDTDTLPTDLELARRLVAAGAVEAASLAELVREQTVDALFDVLRWDQGLFRFAGGSPADAEGTGGAVLDLSIKVDDLLDEAEGRLKEWSAIRQATGPGTGVVSIVRPDEDGEVGLPPDAWSLLTLVDGHRTVDDLVELTGRGQFRTRQLLQTLVDRGVVRVGEADGAGPVEALLAAHTALAGLERRLSGTDDDAPADDGSSHPFRSRPSAAPNKAPDQAPDKAPGPDPDQELSDPAPDAPIPHPASARRRLHTDPELDASTVHRLIQGVEEL